MRLSLAWLDACGHPIVRRTVGGFETVVAVWPTRADGSLEVDRLHETYVAVWRLTERELVALERVHEDFPLRSHDLMVGPTGFGPCPDALLSTRSPSIAPQLQNLRGRLAEEAALETSLASTRSTP